MILEVDNARFSTLATFFLTSGDLYRIASLKMLKNCVCVYVCVCVRERGREKRGGGGEKISYIYMANVGVCR